MAYSAGPPMKNGPNTQKDVFELGFCGCIHQAVLVHVEFKGMVKVYIYDRVEDVLQGLYADHVYSKGLDNSINPFRNFQVC